MTTTLTNGRQRKSLADQIERLDSILDGLSDGLNEAVAAAVKEAVRAVLTEVLTNPELLARLHPVQAIAIPEPPQPSRWLARAWDGIGRRFGWVAAQSRAGCLRVGQMCSSVRDQVAETTRRFRDRSERLLVAGGCALLRARWLVAPILAAVALAGLTGITGHYLGAVASRGRQRGRRFGHGAGQTRCGNLAELGLAVAGIGGMIGPFE